jgi:outer membrane murein-binding lipoprotein Lpp
MRELLAALANLTKTLNVMDEKFKRIEEDVRDLRKENADLRKEVSTLSAKVAALEEGRKTVAAEMRAALTEAIARWEMERLKEENKELRQKALPPSEQSG